MQRLADMTADGRAGNEGGGEAIPIRMFVCAFMCDTCALNISLADADLPDQQFAISIEMVWDIVHTEYRSAHIPDIIQAHLALLQASE